MEMTEIVKHVDLGVGNYVASVFTIEDAKWREDMKADGEEPSIEVTAEKWQQFVEYIREQQTDNEFQDWFEYEWDHFCDFCDE